MFTIVVLLHPSLGTSTGTGPCWDCINTILTYVEILLNISKSFEILLNIFRINIEQELLLVLKISIN